MPKYLTSDDVCDLLQISRSGFYSLLKKGYLPPPSVQLGVVRRWEAADLEAHLVALRRDFRLAGKDVERAVRLKAVGGGEGAV